MYSMRSPRFGNLIQQLGKLMFLYHQFASLQQGHVAQLVLSGTVPNVYVNQCLFYKLPTAPATTGARYLPCSFRCVVDLQRYLYKRSRNRLAEIKLGQSTITTQEAIRKQLHCIMPSITREHNWGSNQDVSSYDSPAPGQCIPPMHHNSGSFAIGRFETPCWGTNCRLEQYSSLSAFAPK